MTTKNQVYVAIGEETTRGTAESSTVGFFPVINGAEPSFAPDDKRYGEYRGEESSLGDINFRRLSTKWDYSLEFNTFSEMGSTKGMLGTLLRHFFGYGSSAQNAATGQYYHMIYPVYNPLSTDAGFLGAKGLTVNYNAAEGDTIKNHKWEGGIVTGLKFTQNTGELLKISATISGQKRQAAAAEIGSPTFPAENLRFDYADLTCYYGTITRTGSAPDYTNFTFGSATQFIPTSYEINITNGRTDNIVLAGVDYPTVVKNGKFKVTLSIVIDYTDPASGFSSADQYANSIAGIAQTNFFFHYDTGTQAGTGDNHQLYIDLPVVNNMSKTPPDRSLDNDPTITLNYEADFDAATTAYILGIMLKNTATSI